MACAICDHLTDSAADTKLRSDLRTLTLFVDLYCRHKHEDQPRSPMDLKGIDVNRLAGRQIALCSECTKLLSHALVKRSHCPMNPKPTCKHCPSHCYHPKYQAMIREVMRYSGQKMLMSGRLDYLFHLLF